MDALHDNGPGYAVTQAAPEVVHGHKPELDEEIGDLQVERGISRGASLLEAKFDELTPEELHRQLSLLVFLKQRVRADSVGGRMIGFIERMLSRVR